MQAYALNSLNMNTLGMMLVHINCYSRVFFRTAVSFASHGFHSFDVWFLGHEIRLDMSYDLIT